MKIVHLSTWDIRGGAAKCAYHLHHALRQLDHESRMVVLQKDSADENVTRIASTNQSNHDLEFALETIQDRLINHRRTPVSSTLFSIGHSFIPLDRLLPLIEDADIIHLHWVVGLLSSASLGEILRRGYKVVWTLYDMWPMTGGCHFSAGCSKYQSVCDDCFQLTEDPFGIVRALQEDKQTACAKYPVGHPMHIVALCEWMAVSARKSRVFRGLPVHKVHGTVDCQIFGSITKESARQKLGIPSESTVLFFNIGTPFEKRKGLSLLINALNRAMENRLFRLRVESGQIRVLSAGPYISEKWIFPMPVTHLGLLKGDQEIATAYAAADIFLLPSIEDSLPNTLREALASGVPTVAFATGDNQELFQYADVGALAAKFDTDEFARHLLTFCFHPEKLPLLSKNCKQLVNDHLNSKQHALDYLEIYHQLL